MLDGVFQPALGAGFEVAEAEGGFGFVAGGEDEIRAVRGDDGAESAGRGFGDDVLLPGDSVAADELPEGKSDVVREQALAAAVVEELAVRREASAE